MESKIDFDATQKRILTREAAETAGRTLVLLIEETIEGFDDDDHRRVILKGVWDHLKNHPLAKKKPQKPVILQHPAVTEQDHVVQYALDQYERIIDAKDDPDLPIAGIDFAESVAARASGIAATIEVSGVVTTAQKEALENMEDGLLWWFRD